MAIMSILHMDDMYMCDTYIMAIIYVDIYGHRHITYEKHKTYMAIMAIIYVDIYGHRHITYKTYKTYMAIMAIMYVSHIYISMYVSHMYIYGNRPHYVHITYG